MRGRREVEDDSILMVAAVSSILLIKQYSRQFSSKIHQPLVVLNCTKRGLERPS